MCKGGKVDHGRGVSIYYSKCVSPGIHMRIHIYIYICIYIYVCIYIYMYV